MANDLKERNVNLISNLIGEKTTKEVIKQVLGTMSSAVKSSLGPFGHNTIIQKKMEDHQITKDGFTILDNLTFAQYNALMIHEIILNISKKLVDSVGDGSSSCIVISDAVYNSLVEIKERHKINDNDLLNIVKYIFEETKKLIKERAIPVNNFDQIEEICKVSTNNNEEISSVIRNIYEEIGFDATITFGEDVKEVTHYNIKKGMEFHNNYIDPIFTNNPEKTECNLDNPYIFLTKDNLTQVTARQLQRVIEDIYDVRKENRPIVVIAKSFDTIVIKNIARLKQGGIEIIPLMLPFGTQRSLDKYEDLLLLLNGSNIDLNDPTTSGLIKTNLTGTCGKVQITNNKILFLDFPINPSLDKRIDELKFKIRELNEKLDGVNYKDQIRNLEWRIKRLTDSVAVLYLGGYSVIEKMNKKFLAEDAILACRSSVKNGIVPGCNISILEALSNVEIDSVKEEKFGKEIFEEIRHSLKTAFKAAFKAVLQNKLEDSNQCDVIIAKCLVYKESFDLINETYKKHSETKVINSAETEIMILDAVSSIVMLLVNSNQMLVENAHQGF